MIFVIGFFVVSFVVSSLVVFACMLSARISRHERWSESYEGYQQEQQVPNSIAPQS